MKLQRTRIVPVNIKREEQSFANLNLVGPCNLSCSFCIGKLLPDLPQLQHNCLHTPVDDLPNIHEFLRQMNKKINWIMVTGLNTDPLLYNDLQNMIDVIHSYDLKCALRTNGLLFEEKKNIINTADKISYSLHTLDKKTALMLLGINYIPDWETIFNGTIIPTKVNIVVCPENVREINEIIVKLQSWNIKRVAIREAFGFEPVKFEIKYKKIRKFCNNPVYNYKGMEITHWNTNKTTVNSYNYIASTGEIINEYRLWDAMYRANKK